MIKLTSANVQLVVRDSLWPDDDPAIKNLKPGEVPECATIVEGIRQTYGFSTIRLESHRQDVIEMIRDIDPHFRMDGANAGLGWSFLNLCQDRHGHLWTSDHAVCEALCALAIGLKLAEWNLPREFWSSMPGGMPYIGFDLSGKRK